MHTDRFDLLGVTKKNYRKKESNKGGKRESMAGLSLSVAGV